MTYTLCRMGQTPLRVALMVSTPVVQCMYNVGLCSRLLECEEDLSSVASLVLLSPSEKKVQ